MQLHLHSHSAPHSPRFGPLQAPFHRAKSEALQLLKDIDLYSHREMHQYLQTVERITAMIQRCPTQQKGQIFLLLCQSALTINKTFLSLPLPQQFPLDVFGFIVSLTDEGAQQGSRPKACQIYRGRFKGTTQKALAREGKGKLKDLLLIERYDKLLITLLKELESTGFKQKLIFSRQVILLFRETYRLAQRYLEVKDFQDYKCNIENLISMTTPNRFIKRQSQSLSLSKNYMIIDSSQISESLRAIRRLPKHASILSLHTNRSTSSKKSSRKVSNSELQDIEALSQKLYIRKSAIANRSLNRPSGSSNSSLRSSLYMNHHFTSATKHASNFMKKEKLSPRSSSKIQRGSQLKIKDKRPERKSRFQLMSKMEEETLRKEFQMYEGGQIQGSSDEEDDQEQDIRVRDSRVRTRRETSKIFSCFEDVDRTNWHEIQPFFIFLEEGHRLHLVRVEQLKSRDDDVSQGTTNNTTLTLKLVQPEIRMYLEYEWLFEENEEMEFEEMCRIFLISHASSTQREDKSVRLQIGIDSSSRGGNLLRVRQDQSGMLMGFIRKISTFFIHQVRYSRDELKGCYEEGVRKRLVTDKKGLILPLHIKSRLLNYDLSMSFQDESVLLAREGTVIDYIQHQDPLSNTLQTQATFKLTYEHCSLRQFEQVQMQRVWVGKGYPLPWQPKKKKGRRNPSSRIYKTLLGDESVKKLRRTHHNKSSIKLSNKSLQIDTIQENQAKGQSRFASKIDIPVSEKRLSVVNGCGNQPKTKNQRIKDKKSHSFIQTLHTDRGYKLVKKIAVQDVQGVKYHEYRGHLQRNPQLLRLWKNEASLAGNRCYLRSSLSVRGKSSQVSSSCLITFLKPLLNDGDDSFMGYLVSEVKIMDCSPNRCIFIETYWERMQKHFLFTLSSEFFEQLTDINTTQFRKQPFLQGEEPVFKKKDKEKRTSVFKMLPKQRLNEGVLESSHKTQRYYREHSGGSQLNESLKKYQNRPQDTKNKFGQTAKTEKFHDSANNFKHNKLSRKNQLKREIVSAMKNRLVKNMSFVWRDHTIRLIIKNTVTNQKTSQSNDIESFEAEGRELAAKNVHEAQGNPEAAAATELVLIKYKQNNLTNLNFFTQEGLNQVSLEHVYIKNNADLFGRYQSVLELSSLPLGQNIRQFYQERNRFFVKPEQKEANKLTFNRLKNTVQKFSIRDEQKRFKYVEILGYAKQCCLPFEFVERKRKKAVKQSFVVPNRYKALDEREELLHITLESNFVRVATLLGEEVIVFTISKLEVYLPYIRQLPQQQFKRIFLHRVLEDPDILRLCLAEEQCLSV